MTNDSLRRLQQLHRVTIHFTGNFRACVDRLLPRRKFPDAIRIRELRSCRRKVLKALTYFEDGDLPSLAADIRALLIGAAANVREIPEVRCIGTRLRHSG
jgi:hypothetical protein